MAISYIDAPQQIVKTGTVQTVKDTDPSIKHASVPAISGYTLKGLTMVPHGDGFYQGYSIFELNNHIYIRDTGSQFTSDTQFTFMYVAVYEKT